MFETNLCKLLIKFRKYFQNGNCLYGIIDWLEIILGKIDGVTLFHLSIQNHITYKYIMFD